MYFAWRLGIKNHILQNTIGRIFHQLPLGGEGKSSGIKVIKLNQGIRPIKSDQRIEPVKTNQGMGLIKLNQDIKS